MSVAVKKVNGVDAVNVSLNEGKASIRFKPESTARYDDVRTNIEKNGFSVREARLRVRGKLQRVNGGGFEFVVSGSNEVFNLSPVDLKDQGYLQEHLSQDMVINATIPTPEKNKKQDKMLLKSVASGK